MAWTYDITAPAVGDKITAAGFGLQADLGMAELQSVIDTTTGGTAAAGATSWATQRDSILLRDWARPGVDAYGMSGTRTSIASAGPTTIVAGPVSGRRVIKSLLINAPTIGSSVTLTLASKTLAYISMPGGILSIPTCLPIASGENLQATTAAGTVVFTAAHADRSDTLVDRLGYASGSTSGTLVASSGSDRVITHLWIANPSASTATTATVAIGATNIITTVELVAQSFFTIDEPIFLPSGSAVTWTGDSTTSVTYMASGH